MAFAMKNIPKASPAWRTINKTTIVPQPLRKVFRVRHAILLPELFFFGWYLTFTTRGGGVFLLVS